MLLPVIDRELRASARHPFTYTLRVIGAAALLATLASTALSGRGQPGDGGVIFSSLHTVLFIAIWVLVPLLASDCISRERREGTLPLLFLTPLRPRHIVSAKSLAHGLRAFTLWLAAIPVLTIPFLLGGIGWREVILSILVNFSSLCLALAAGVLASANEKAWTRSMAMALFIAFLFWLMMLMALPWLVAAFASPATQNTWRRTWGFGEPSPFIGLTMVLNPDRLWQALFARSAAMSQTALFAYGALATLSLTILFLASRLAAWTVKRVWREGPPSPRTQWLQQKLFSPIFFRSWLKRWLQHQLQRNPIGWLEQRSWRGRLVVWSWLAIVVCIYSSLFANFFLYQRGFHSLQSFLGTLLAFSMALSASSSFRRERETGVLELLLIAPLQEWQIIRGRLLGLWTQFLPSIVLLCGVWLYCGAFMSADWVLEYTTVFHFLVLFATVPVVGLFFSLTQRNFLAGLLSTVIFAMVLPETLVGLLRYLEFWSGPAGPLAAPPFWTMLLAPLIQVSLALALAFRLHSNLQRRTFALESR